MTQQNDRRGRLTLDVMAKRVRRYYGDPDAFVEAEELVSYAFTGLPPSTTRDVILADILFRLARPTEGQGDAIVERPDYLAHEEAEMWDVTAPFPNAHEDHNASSTTSLLAPSTSTDAATAETRNGSDLVDLARLIYSEIPKEKPKQIVVTSATGPHLGVAAFMVAVPWDRLTSMEQQPYLAAAGRVMAARQAFVDAMIAVASSDSRVWQERYRNEKARADRLEAALADQQGMAEKLPQSAASGGDTLTLARSNSYE